MNHKTLAAFSACLFASIGSGYVSSQQAPAPASPPPAEPALEQVLELDEDERKLFFDQRLKLHCNVCHTSEMIEQQRLTLAQWQAELTKMIGWGATLPKDYAGLMAEHLSKLYPPDNKTVPAMMTPEEAATLSAQADQKPVDEAESANLAVHQRFLTQCATCHGPDATGNEIGPRLIGRPILTRPDAFANHLKEGRGRMPAFLETIPANDLQAIRRWLLGRSFSWKK